MKKTLLCTALLSLLSTTIQADNTLAPATNAMPNAVKSVPENSNIPATPQPAGTTTPTAQTEVPQAAAVIDCKYHVPANTTHIEESLISIWAGKAAVQSFQFGPSTIDQELTELKSCYTDSGWQSFNDALQKSGNIDAIKTQHLNVSSQADGEVKLTTAGKDNQWKAIVPLQVVYQNDKEKLTQLLDIELLVGRKPNGDLGVMQMIATPRQTTTPTTGTPPTPTPVPATEPQTISH